MLSMNITRLRYNAMAYPKLHKLSLELNLHCKQDLNPELGLTDTISLNPSIAHLHINGRNARLGSALWSSVSALPALRTLSLYYGFLDTEDAVIAFRDMCAKLTNVTLIETLFLPENSCRLMTSAAPQHIRTLVLTRIRGLDEMDQLALISQYPRLQELKWHIYSSEDNVATVFQHFSQRIASGAWPDLESLDLFNLSAKVRPSGKAEKGQVVQDSDAARILRNLRRVVKFNLALSKFRVSAFKDLSLHFDTLRELVVRDCPGVSSIMLLHVMHSCPQLETLEGDVIHAKDAVLGDPWRCLALKSLTVHFAFGESEQNLQPLIFERLSDLTLLEKLFVYRYRASQVSYPNGLDFRLQSGLGALAKLRRMSQVSFTDTWQDLNVEEVQWMISNWKHLSILHGILSKDPDTNSALKSLLKPHLAYT
ncbi:hypothetical protein BGX31_010085 [Mortierella sp. GBA43]|nr:hypothetical protein BGX31_010085 [Mortierella sp. GBA43]